MKELTDHEQKALQQVVDFNSTDQVNITIDYSHSSSYALYLHFNEKKVGFTSFKNVLTYLSGYQMLRKLLEEGA